MQRRRFVQGIGTLLTAATAPFASAANSRRPKRLKPGDTLALVSPADATYETEVIEHAIASVRALGFEVKEASGLRARYGQFGGPDELRARAINESFADPTVDGILCLTGGSGCTRILDRIDYGLVRQHPKFFGGFSDVTALLNALWQRAGLVTFHCPMAASEWNPFSVQHFRAVTMDGGTELLAVPPPGDEELVPRDGKLITLRGGRARGPLVGGNLAVLTALAGSPYFPDCRGAVLMLEEVNEYLYRVDRMLSQLRLIGALKQLSGVVLGQFTRCTPGDGYGTLTLEEIFDDYFKPLNIPVLRGAMFGHVKRKLTLPVGAAVELDADAQTLRLTQADPSLL